MLREFYVSASIAPRRGATRRRLESGLRRDVSVRRRSAPRVEQGIDNSPSSLRTLP
ncbi:MAG: hypothetical protein ABI809_07375 [Caldimonas sp.]